MTGSRASFDDLVIVLAVAAYAAVGTAVELARPGHLVGRLMLVGALAWGIGEGLLAWGLTGLDREPWIRDRRAARGARHCGSRVRLAGARAGAAAGVPGRPLAQSSGDPSGGDGRDGFTVASLAAPVPLENRMAAVDNPIGLPESWQMVADLLAIASLAARLRRPCWSWSAR